MSDADIGNGAARLLLGDCLERLKGLPDCSVDAVVTDPPYGLSDHSLADTMACLQAWLAGEEYRPKKRGFMGRSWDAWVPGPEVWREVLRVLKPGGHVVAFAGSRTHDLMSMALRLAGFENRDTVMWVYGSGFPKSMDVSKAIDKAAGAERTEIVGVKPGHEEFVNRTDAHAAGGKADGWDRPWKADADAVARSHMVMAPATDAARQWQGWGTALKPSFEPALLFRKPLIGTVAQNVLQHGTGALNIDACRVPFAGDDDEQESKGKNQHATFGNGARSNAILGDMGQNARENYNPPGRWPANICHDGSPEVVAQFPNSLGAGGSVPNVKVTGYGGGIGTGSSDYLGGERTKVDSGSGSAARFFYCAKASKRDRDEGLTNAPQPFVQFQTGNGASGKPSSLSEGRNTEYRNVHPTVKPTDLMAYLCRLVTPPGGVVLDPFLGSGSTGKAAIREGFRFIGCELSPEYLAIARARIEHAWRQANPEPAPEADPEPGDQLALFA